MMISNFRMDVASSAEGCPLTFDSWSCWNYTQPGEVNLWEIVKGFYQL